MFKVGDWLANSHEWTLRNTRAYAHVYDIANHPVDMTTSFLLCCSPICQKSLFWILTLPNALLCVLSREHRDYLVTTPAMPIHWPAAVDIQVLCLSSISNCR